MTNLIKYWLGKWFIFQTFDELDQVKDVQGDIKQLHELLKDGEAK